jgi:hypothetical protein
MLQINKTFEYLSPLLRLYSGLVISLVTVDILSIGIGDKCVPKQIDKSPCLYIKIKSSKSSALNKLLDFLEVQEYFVRYYNYDHKTYVLVIKIPAKFLDSYLKFIQGKYSEMYTKEEIKAFFDTGEDYRLPTLEKLNKTEKGLLFLQQGIKETFGVELDIEEMKEIGFREFDLPPTANILNEIII